MHPEEGKLNTRMDARHQQRATDAARMRISKLPVRKLDLMEIFRQACEIAAETLEVERVGIWLFVQERAAIRCACVYERSKRRFSEGAMLRVQDYPSYFSALKARKTVSAESAAHDPRTSELHEGYFAPLGIISTMDAAIMLNEEAHGVVCHEHVGTTREWSTEERDFAGSVADLLALKIKSAKLEKLRAALQDLDADRAAARYREGIARMAASVAHDFRNLLTVVVGGAEEIVLESAPGSPIARIAREIMQAAERGTALTAELMSVGRSGGNQPQVLDPGEELARFLPLMQKAAGPQHVIKLQRDHGAGWALIDRSQLERLVLNLVLNARDAMASGGTITVSVRGAERSGKWFVQLAVQDTGGGIDPALMELIFDPFFSTKPRERGTGLGLTMVRQAVEHAGGQLRVENVPGQGATFCVELPRVSS